MDAEQILQGGMANPGAVVRVGDTVRRPRRPNSEATASLLKHLEVAGFKEAQRYLGTDALGRDVFTFIEGEVPTPPMPSWASTESVVAEVGGLLRRYHDAVASFAWEGESWSDELADPVDKEILCHNDVCPENVVFANGRAVGLIDFDFASPGRAIWDAAMTIRMWAWLADPSGSPQRTGDQFGLLGAFARGYRIDPSDAEDFVNAIELTNVEGLKFVRRHVEAGEVPFVQMWDARGREQWSSRDSRWYDEHRDRLVAAVRNA